MICYFSHSIDNQCQASAVYLENLHRLFIQDEDSGMIQIEYLPDSQVILLFRLGELTRAYHLEKDRSAPLSISRYKSLLVGDALKIRSVSLPLHAVRTMIQALDCQPPAAVQQHSAQSLAQYFSTLKQDHFNGLLHLRLPDLDGFQVWLDGAPLSSQGVYSTSRGFVDSLPNFQSFRSNGEKLFQVELYQPVTDTLSWRLIGLSTAVGELLSSVVAGYQKLVGYSMVNALNYDLNTTMRMFHYNIRMVGDEMVDHDLFTDAATAQATYTGLFDCLLQHVTSVVGSQLTQRTFSEAFHGLDQQDQSALNQYALTPAAIAKIQKETIG